MARFATIVKLHGVEGKVLHSAKSLQSKVTWPDDGLGAGEGRAAEISKELRLVSGTPSVAVSYCCFLPVDLF